MNRMRSRKAGTALLIAGLLAAALAVCCCAAEESLQGEVLISERISWNYTAVSSGYSMPLYAGPDIVLHVDQAVTDAGKAEWTEETSGYSGASRVLSVQYGNTVCMNAEIPQDGLYALRIDYYAYDEKLPEDRQTVLPNRIALGVDSEYPFYECRNIKLEADWLRSPETAYDRYGDEMVSLPKKSRGWKTTYLTDSTGRRTEALLLEMSAGSHEIEITACEGGFLLGNLTLCTMPEAAAAETIQAAEGSALITLQGEQYTSTNTSSIHGIMEYDAALDPYEVEHTRLNTIDSDSFRLAGDSVTWEFSVPAAGWYNIALNYRQSDKTDFPVFVDIFVNGQIPSDAFREYPLQYGSGWQRHTLADSDNNKLSVWLEEGTQTLTLRLTIAPLREAMEALDEMMYGINDLALEITKVAGTNADQYRDLKLSRYIPDLTEKLNGYASRLRALEKQYIPYSASSSGVPVMSSMLIAARQLESLAENPDEIPYRIRELSSSSNSANQFLANTLDNLLRNNLAIDRIWIYQEDASLPAVPGFDVAAGKSIERFAGSFSSQRYSTANTDRNHLQVWVNRSNQYVQIMQKLIDERFTPATGIQVDLSIMPDQYKLVLAKASGKAPDVATGINYTIPYELAIRGALKDLTSFADFREVASVYEPGFFLTGTIGDGVYSMPETMNFWVLFYRTDVMDKLKLPVPQTMDDVIAMLPELQMRGLNFYYATAGMLSMRNFHGTTPLLVQHGGALYYDTAEKGTALGSRESVEGFTALTDLFTIYNLPVNVDNFYQHFRNGDIPIGIADFFTYNLIRNAAPELDGSWKIALIPGTVRSDGTLDRTTCGCSDSTVIFTSNEEREEQAWQFIRWWSGTETQALFGRMVQSIYGDEYIWPTANLEAFDLLPWDTEDKQVIREFAGNVVDVARVPGTYMLEREMSNAFNDIVVNGDNEQTRIDQAVKTINREIRRKLEEFGYVDSQGNVLEEYRIPTMESVRVILGR